MQQRIYVGITGLAAVFLLTLLAASLLALLGQDTRGTSPPPANSPAARRIAAEDAPKEPLAELGVAPGNAAPRTSPGPAPAAIRPPVAPPHPMPAHH